MCKIGDIILVREYKDSNIVLRRHSFIVIEDNQGKISGMPYDMICNVLSSFKNDVQRKRKLEYAGNFPINNCDTCTNPDNGLDGYLKTDQLYFFNKEKIDYQVIGNVKKDIMDLVMEFIHNSDFEIKVITDNL